MTKKLFIHYHIFKNAGTSLGRALQDTFKGDMYFFDSGKPGGVVTNSMLVDFVVSNIKNSPACLSSHQACLASSNVPGYQVIKFILLREPLRRFFSMYNYHKRITPSLTQFDLMASQLSFKDFMKWLIQNAKVVRSNFQTNYCSKIDSKVKNITISEYMMAVENLHNADAVGTVERYNESLTLFNKVLNANQMAGKLKSYLENSSNQQNDPMGYIHDQLGPELIGQIIELNEFDYKLYDYANSILDNKVHI